MENQKKPKINLSKKEKPFNQYLKYSGIAFQMIAVILMGVFIGKFLDKLFQSNIIFTTILTLFFVGLSLYIALKDFIK